jgi:hypothetical protein
MTRRSGDRKGVLQNAYQELGYADGTFRFAQLPGGEYFLAALSAEAPDDWRLPSFLRDVIAHAVGVDGRAAIRVGPVLDAFPVAWLFGAGHVSVNGSTLPLTVSATFRQALPSVPGPSTYLESSWTNDGHLDRMPAAVGYSARHVVEHIARPDLIQDLPDRCRD